ncbi:MAG: ABC transporter permease [bacterium]|nr:ABC transporter permease [bacterium]
MKIFSLILPLAIRNLFRNKRRSFITILAISIGVGSAVLLSSIARGLSKGLAEDAVKTLLGHAQIHSPLYLKDPVAERSFEDLSEQMRDLQNKNIISKWTSRVRVPGVILSERETFGINIVGINPKEEHGLSFIENAIVEGKFFTDIEDSGIIVGKKLLQRLKTQLGKRVVLVTQDYNNKIVDRGFKIVGIFDSGLESTENSYVFIGRKVAQNLLSLNNKISEISFFLPDDYQEDDQIATGVNTVNSYFPDHEVKAWWEIEPLAVALRQVQDGFLIVWFFVVIVSVSFGVINTQLMSVFERAREFGVMMALGTSPRLLLYIVSSEALFLLLIGMFFGNLIGVFGLYSLSSGIDLSGFAAASEHLGFSKLVLPRFVLRDWILCDGILIVLGFIGALYPAWKASRYEPVVAISGREK